MKRMTDTELQARIQKFLTRKFEELDMNDAPSRRSWPSRARIRWHAPAF